MPRVRKQARTTLQQQRAKETRHALVVAAERQWRARDFDEVSIEDICAEVGVSKGLFYFYFPKKEFLLIALVFAKVFPQAEDVQRLLEGDLDTLDLCRALTLNMAQRAKELPAHMVRRGIEAGLQHHREYRERFGGEGGWGLQLEKVFERARERGELAAGWTPELLAAATGWMLVHGLLYWASDPEDRTDLAAILRDRAELVAAGGMTTRRA